MPANRHVQWLLNELPGLREQQIISAETEDALRKHYTAELVPGRNYFLLALGILGLALVGGGIILIFNYNWDMLNQTQRIGISFLPLLLGFAVSLFTLIRGKTQLWREASAILTAVGSAVAVALLSQIYQLNGSLSDYMTLVLITSLPLIFIFDSIGLAALYCFGMFGLLDFSSTPNPVEALILAGILAYSGYHQFKKSSYRVACRYLLLPVLWYVCFRYSRHCPVVMLFTMAGFFLLVSCDLAEENTSFGKNPWFPVSFVLMTVLLAVSAESNRLFDIHVKDTALIVWFWIVVGLLLAGTAALAVRNFLRKKKDVMRIMVLVMVVLALIGYLLSAAKAQQLFLLFRVAMNCFMGAFGISLICAGFRKGSLMVFNEGMLLGSVLFAVRFFSADLGLIARGIGMIGAGLIIIGANVYLSKRIRNGKEACHE